MFYYACTVQRFRSVHYYHNQMFHQRLRKGRNSQGKECMQSSCQNCSARMKTQQQNTCTLTVHALCWTSSSPRNRCYHLINNESENGYSVRHQFFPCPRLNNVMIIMTSHCSLPWEEVIHGGLHLCHQSISNGGTAWWEKERSHETTRLTASFSFVGTSSQLNDNCQFCA